MTNPIPLQTTLPTLQSLSPEDSRSDLYITAIHELDRRRRHWSLARLEKIAVDLGIDKHLLALTWCLIHAVSRTRRKRAPARKDVKKLYTRLVGDVQKPVANGLSPEQLDSARETLLTAGWTGLSAMRRVAALLRGRESLIRMRETAEFVDCSDSEEEGPADANADPIMRLCKNGVMSLPGVENVDEGKVVDVTRRLREFARRVGSGESADGVSVEAMRMARHRYNGVEWVVRCEKDADVGDTDMEKLIDEISSEARVSLHPVTKRLLQDTFHDESGLTNGDLTAFRALVPESFVKVVRERDVRKLVGLMKTGDVEVAKELLKRFGSTERCLRKGVEEIGETVMELLHGFDPGFHAAVKERVRNVWLVARVMKDKFGDIETGREAGFMEIMGGDGEVVELTLDERLAFYEGVCGMSERQGSVWRVFKGLCEAGVEDVVQVLARLINEFGEDGLRKGLMDSHLGVLSCLIGINGHAVTRLRRFI